MLNTAIILAIICPVAYIYFVSEEIQKKQIRGIIKNMAIGTFCAAGFFLFVRYLCVAINHFN